MDAIILLLNDHRELRQHIKDFRNAGDDDTGRKSAAFEKMVEELAHHTDVEEQVFYPAVKEAVPDTEDVVNEGVEEHHVADVVIAEAQALSPDDDQWEAKITVLCENVEHHIDEEEEELFPKVREALTNQRLQELGAEMERFLTRYELRHETVDELRARASDAEIEGRSSMNKDELVAALADRS